MKTENQKLYTYQQVGVGAESFYMGKLQNSPSFTAEDQNVWSFTSGSSPYDFTAQCLGTGSFEPRRMLRPCRLQFLKTGRHFSRCVTPSIHGIICPPVHALDFKVNFIKWGILLDASVNYPPTDTLKLCKMERSRIVQ
jgi:hypothetical protein